MNFQHPFSTLLSPSTSCPRTRLTIPSRSAFSTPPSTSTARMTIPNSEIEYLLLLVMVITPVSSFPIRPDSRPLPSRWMGMDTPAGDQAGLFHATPQLHRKQTGIARPAMAEPAGRERKGASSGGERGRDGAIEVVGVEAEVAELGEWLEEEQMMLRQSQGASGMEGSQPSRAPSGSWRASLKAVKAWNSTVGTTTVVSTARRRRGG
ncbi:unnamed protein product [Linum trigynum]